MGPKRIRQTTDEVGGDVFSPPGGLVAFDLGLAGT